MGLVCQEPHLFWNAFIFQECEANNPERKTDGDRLIIPPSFTLRPPSCEPCPPSPERTLWTDDGRNC